MRFPRRLVAPAILGMGVLVTAVVVAAFPRSGQQRPTASPSVPASAVVPATPRPPVAAPVTYRDFAFRPTDATKPRSGSAGGGRRLWFAGGAWWGALLEPRTGELGIFRLDWKTQSWVDTGTVVDDRANVLVDAVADGTHVWIGTARPGSSAADGVRVAAFTLASGMDRYRLDPDTPDQVIGTGADEISLARDGAGTLWLAALSAGDLRIAHRESTAGNWSVGPAPAGEGPAAGGGSGAAGGGIASAAVVASAGRARLLWVRSNEDVLFDATHDDAAPTESWVVSRADVPGLRTVDAPLAATVVDPALPDTLVVAHLAGDGSERSSDAQVLLLASGEDGAWSRSLVARFKDKLTRPVVAVDTARDEVVVAMTARSGGASIVMKRAPLDRPAFDNGAGEPLIASAADSRVDEATTAGGPLGADAGLVVLASDETTGRYLHGTVAPETGLPPASRGASDPEPTLLAGPVTLVDDRFEIAGRALTPFPWALRPDHDRGRLSIISDPIAGSVAALETATSGGDVLACRTLPSTLSGTVHIRMAFRVDGRGSTASTVLSLRGHGPRIVDVRVEPVGRLAIITDGAPSPTDLAIRRGAWYTVTASVTPSDRLVEVAVGPLGATTPAWRSSVAWPSATAPVVDGLCVGTASGAKGLDLRIDDLLVVREAR